MNKVFFIKNLQNFHLEQLKENKYFNHQVEFLQDQVHIIVNFHNFLKDQKEYIKY